MKKIIIERNYTVRYGNPCNLFLYLKFSKEGFQEWSALKNEAHQFDEGMFNSIKHFLTGENGVEKDKLGDSVFSQKAIEIEVEEIILSIKNKKYVDRLFQEWMQHGKIIVSVDYDSTLFPYSTIENQDDIDRTIKLVKLAHETGAYIVIFTASDPERYSEIMEYCKKLGLHVDSINKNPIELPYGNSGKIYYNINLCDRSGLNEALDILETAMYMVRGKQHSPSDIG